MKKTILLVSGLLVLTFSVLAQNRQIKGKVQDETGEPVPNATVLISGQTGGAQSDAQGNFTIATTKTGDVVLVVSSTGYESKTVTTDGAQLLTITLNKSITSLDDVVVIGYQTVKRRDLTGSVSSVSSKQIKDIPINSAAQALAGRLAGVQITGTEGSPDAEAVIRVRGGGSITQDNSPLYIIDGIQVEDALSVISPQDIASVDILKDASATAIYGARGANGVVIITTKGGRNQKAVVSYNGLVGVSRLANKLDVMNPYDFVMYQYERSRGSSQDEQNFLNTYGLYSDLDLYKSVPFTDWQDQLFGRDAMQQTHNVSLTGGNSLTTYNLSLTANMQEGVLRGSDFDRKLVNFKFEHKLNDKIKIGFNTRYNNTVVDGAGTSNPGSSSTNRLRHAVKYRPFLLGGQDLYTYDEDYANETNSNSLQLVNPILYNDAEYRRNITNVLNLGASIDIKLTSFLTFRSTAGFDFTDIRRTAVDDSITGNSRQNGNGLPMASIGTNNRLTINNSNVLTFSNAKLNGRFNEKNNLTVLVGHEVYQNRLRGENQFSRYFPAGISPKKALGNMNLGELYLNPSSLPSFEVTNRIVSVFGRINYEYDQRFLVTLTGRRDGSSKFSEGNKWGFFPSASVAWRISKEKFMDNVNFFNDLKIRASYGEAGNNRIGDFLYLTQFVTNTQYWLNNQLNTGFSPDGLANNNLVWERTTSRNVGLDATFLRNKIEFSIDVYKNTTKDLLINVPVPTSSGYTTQIQNVGSTENRGVEMQINATPISKKDFTWTANFNISFNKNEITALSTYQDSYLQASGWGVGNTPADFIVKVGEPVGSIRGFITDGYYTLSDFDYDPNTGTYTLKADQPNNIGVTSLAPYPGRLKFKDLDGNGLIDDADRTIIGVAQPKFFGGLNQQFSYKNFDLSVFFNFQVGNDVINANKLEFTNAYTPNANMLSVMNNRWRNVDANGVVVTDPTELAKINANATLWSPSTSSNAFALHTWAVEDGSFLRLNNITLGYNLPESILKKLKIQRFRVYITGNNLHVFTKYSGYDPEVNTRRST
ncbi:MAG TPA: TonB-dependent receptor, partial [Chitinophagaceae bacterium]|nr:TonB-dependent receptor [Chitinophagaceae bacterium]